jgi:hypothetical protein
MRLYEQADFYSNRLHKPVAAPVGLIRRITLSHTRQVSPDHKARIRSRGSENSNDLEEPGWSDPGEITKEQEDPRELLN